MIDNYIKVSKFGSPHGLKGYIRLIPIIDPPELLNELKYLYLEKDNQFIQLEVEVLKPYKKIAGCLKLGD